MSSVHPEREVLLRRTVAMADSIGVLEWFIAHSDLTLYLDNGNLHLEVTKVTRTQTASQCN